MKDTSTGSAPSSAPEGDGLPGVPTTEEELKKIRERIGQQNKPQKPPTFKDGIDSIKRDDFMAVHKTPCAREGFLAGIGGGAAAGGLRYILGASIPRAANWAVGFGALFAIIRYEVCQSLRRAEHAKVKRVVTIQNEKQTQLRRQEEARRAEAAAKKAAEEEAAKAKKSWYRLW
ncbi:hypothetical protein GQ53DRAFT_748894 [Thozetella sp. PMI_491]|nr:hypothetical protein GQ53DRAFT_748894 [Thozetella sp. PMI_491]